MVKSHSLQIGNITLGTKPDALAEPVDPETPFRLLVLGNFRGDGPDSATLSNRRAVLVDRDNLDEVLAKFRPEVHLQIHDHPPARLKIAFSDLESFHPDQLFQRLEPFTALRDLQDRLSNPKTFARAAAELRSQQSVAPQPAAAPKAESSGTNLLEEILGSAALAPAAPPGRTTDWNQFLQSVVAPHIVANIEPEQEKLLAHIDAAVSEQMRRILHQPNYQDLESAWRGVDFLMRRLETGSELKLYVLHVTKEELAADLGGDDLRSSGLYKLLVEQTVETPGAVPWAAVAGNYTFDRSLADAVLLARIGAIAQEAGAPFLSHAGSSLLGCASLVDSPSPRDWREPAEAESATAWHELRSLPQASNLALALPRFLLRLPYGKEASPIERFAFEEMAEGSAHAHYLWGNPAFLSACLLGQSFSSHGWHFRPGAVDEIDNLPLHIYQDDGESHVKPCAEVLLTDSALEAILDRGLIALVSRQNRDVIAVPRMQSFAEATAVVAGRWQS